MTDKITTRQFCFFLSLTMISLKFMALPAQLGGKVGRNAYFVVALFLFLEFFIVLFLLKFMKKNENVCLEDILRKKLGKGYNFIFFSLFSLFFLGKLLLISEGVEVFFKSNFYAEMPFLTYLIPVAFMSLFLCKKGNRAFGRTIEIVIWSVYFAILMSLMMSFSKVDISNLLPFFRDMKQNFFLTCIQYIAWFGDFLFIFLYVGKVKIEKNFERKVIFTYLMTASVILIFFVFFITIFQNNLPYHSLAISNLSQYAVNTSDFFQVDFIPVILWTFALFFEEAFVFNLSVVSFSHAVGRQNKDVIMFVFAFFVASITVYFRLNAEKILSFAVNFLSYLAIIVIILGLLTTIILNAKERKKRIKEIKNVDKL